MRIRPSAPPKRAATGRLGVSIQSADAPFCLPNRMASTIFRDRLLQIPKMVAQ